MNNINLQIFVASKSISYPINYVQGTNTIPIELVLADYDIPTGAEVRIYLRKRSGKEVYNDCTYSGNTITIQPTLQMFAEAGRQLGQVQITKGDKVLVSFVLIFDVEKNIIDSSAIESSNEYTALDALLIEARESIPRATTAAESAEAAAAKAETQAGRAQAAADTANEKAAAADTAATAATTVKNEIERKLEAGEFVGAQGPEGPQGPKGVDGRDGAQGLQGPKGDTGAQGATGPKGDTGPQGPAGPQGPTGPKGDTGLTGPSGVTFPVGGFFTLGVETNGDLKAYYADGGAAPGFRYDEATGKLYYDTEV